MAVAIVCMKKLRARKKSRVERRSGWDEIFRTGDWGGGNWGEIQENLEQRRCELAQKRRDGFNFEHVPFKVYWTLDGYIQGKLLLPIWIWDSGEGLWLWMDADSGTISTPNPHISWQEPFPYLATRPATLYSGLYPYVWPVSPIACTQRCPVCHEKEWI